MRTPHQRWWWLGVAACAAIAGLYALGGTTRLVTHVLLAQLCHGISGGKIFFFLLYVAAACAVLARASGASQRTTTATPSHAPRTTPSSSGSRQRLFLPACVLGLAMAMLSYLWYTSTLHLPRDTPTYHWLHGLNSVNSFTHTHTSKAIIAHVLAWTNLTSLQLRFDTGAPYAAIVPTWISLLTGLSFLVALVESLRTLPRIALAYPARERGFVACAYILAASGLVKCILDGGPAAYDAVLGLITCTLLARATSLADLLAQCKALALPILLLLAVWIGAIQLVSPGALDSQLTMLAYRGAMILLLLVAASGSHHLARPHLARHLLGAAAACTIAFLGFRELRVWLLPLFAEARTHAAQRDGAQWHEAPILPHETFADAYVRLGENPLRVRRTIFPRDATSPSGFYAQLHAFEPNAPAPGATALATLALQHAGVRVVKFEPAPAHDEPGVWYVQVEFPPPSAPMVLPPPGTADTLSDRGGGAQHENERFAGYHALDEALRTAGLSEYVLIPYVFSLGAKE